MEIITGYTGKPHVTSEQDRDVNIGVVGEKSYVLQTGMQLAAEVSSNNEIKIRDGVLMHQGCTASIKKNTYDSLTIINGSQGMKRIDLIVARYEKNQDNGIESLDLKVIQGTPAESTPTVPEYTEGDIQAGDYVADMPMYQVIINGLNITEVKKVCEVAPDIDALKKEIAELNSKIDSSAGSIIGGHGTEEKIGFYIDGNGMKNTLYSKRIQTLGSPVTLPSGCNIVAVDAWMQHNTSGNKYPFPYIDTVSWRVTQVSNFQGNILNWTQGGVDWSNHTGVFVLYYTK